MVRSRRKGGRAARIASHEAPTPDEEKAVWPGMSGGRYKPLTDNDVQQIHNAVLDVLEQIGLANAIPSSRRASHGIFFLTHSGRRRTDL